MLPTSSKLFALESLCEAKNLIELGYSVVDLKQHKFRRSCWTGDCDNCLTFSDFYKKFEKLFNLVKRQESEFRKSKFKRLRKKVKLREKSSDFLYWKYQILERKLPNGKSYSFKDFAPPEVCNKVLYIEKMNNLMKSYLPHLIALNFGNEQLSRVTDPDNPRLPVGTPLVAFDFSLSPKFIHKNMTQNDYHDSQTFGLMPFVAFWTVIEKPSTGETKKVLKKSVYEIVFVNPLHNTNRAMQALDIGLMELQKDMSSDHIIIKNLYVYTDCAPGDQKNRFMLSHLSQVLNKHNEWVPVRYFQRPAGHNKFDFDSEGGLWKRFYFKCALIFDELQFTHYKNFGISLLKNIVAFMNS